jgi:tetratricopeptide (TPR) repeat protein
MQAELSAWRAPLASTRSVSEIHKALQWAPRNPRVLLLDAIAEYEHSKPSDPNASQICAKFKTTAAVFEDERAAVDKVPGWGAAEAYTWLGRCYLDTGDAIKARDALERALLIAPEFQQAHRLLAAITSG